MSQESIIEELIAENTMLRQKLCQIEELGFTSMINILTEKPQLKIAGVLIAEGVWKGVKYDYDEMKKALNKFIGLPVKVMHERSEEFGTKTVGKVIKVVPDDVLRSLAFEAVITDEKAAQMIKDGVFNAVSIKGGFGRIDDSRIPPVGLDYTPIEVSLTGSPACEHCYIFNVKELSKLLKDTNKNVDVGENRMSEDIFEIKEDEVLVLPDNFDELEDFSTFEFEVKKFPELVQELAEKKEETTKVKKVVIKVPAGKYPSTAKKGVKIYGYPYPYYAYPYYYYYPTYGYPTYYYYYYPSLDELLDILIENESYREFMKKCMAEKGGGPEALKECAAEWKKKQQEQSEESENINKETAIESEGESMTELAKIKCPVCGKEFSSKQAFLKHWKEEHEAKYGAYQLIKKFVQKMSEDRSFVRQWKNIIALEETEAESAETKQEEQTESKESEQSETESKEEKKEEKTSEEEKVEKRQEEKKEEETVKETGAETVRKEIGFEDILEEIKKNPELGAKLAAELMVKQK